MPEWFLLIVVLGILSLLGLSRRRCSWRHPALPRLPRSWPRRPAARVTRRFSTVPRSRMERWAMHAMVGLMHVIQPLARLRGRLRHGLTIWRHRGASGMAMPIPRTFPLLVTRYQLPEHWLRAVQGAINDAAGVVQHGGDFDAWDLEVRGGVFGSSRLLMAFEDTGSGTQLVRVRTWPVCHRVIWLSVAVLTALAASAGWSAAYLPMGVLGLGAAFLTFRIARDCGVAGQTIREALVTLGIVGATADGRLLEPEREQA